MYIKLFWNGSVHKFKESVDYFGTVLITSQWWKRRTILITKLQGILENQNRGWRIRDRKSGIKDRLKKLENKINKLWIVVMWTTDCRQISQNITPLTVLSTKFKWTTSSLTDSVTVLAKTWNFPAKWNTKSLSKWYKDKMHPVYSSKHCTLRPRKYQLYKDIKSRY